MLPNFTRLPNLSFLFLIALLHTSFFATGQNTFYNKQSNFLNANKFWPSYGGVGLDFNSGVPPKFVVTQMPGAGEGSASACDPSTGELLFYTNGYMIWDKNNQAMPNGTGLIGNAIGNPIRRLTQTTMQGVCIVPMIDVPNKYFLFSLTPAAMLSSHAPNNVLDSYAVYYSVVDMSLNGGLGDIDNTLKNIPLTPKGMRYSEAMIAVPGNCNDVWLLLHRSDSAVYDAYHITKDGIDTTPVTSITNGPRSIPYYYNINGSMAISPDRTQLAYTSGFAIATSVLGGYGAIAEFDPNQGIVSNEIVLGGISSSTDTLYRVIGSGGAFSPDGSKFYTHEVDLGTGISSLVQYDVSSHTYSVINGSRYTVSASVPYGKKLRLYGDTIYCTDTAYVNIITDPNKAGAACNYLYKAITSIILPKPIIDYSITSELVYPLDEMTDNTNALDTLICSPDFLEGGMELSALEYDATFQYTWSNGSSSSKLQVYDTGVYWVAYKNNCGVHKVDSFNLRGDFLYVPQITINNMNRLGTTRKYAHYQWLYNGNKIEGANDSVYVVEQNGDYQVIVTNESGCSDTSAIYQVTNVSINDAATMGQYIRIYPNPAVDEIHISAPVAVNTFLVGLDGRTLKYAYHATSVRISNLSSGVYYMKIFDTSGLLLRVEKIIKISQ